MSTLTKEWLLTTIAELEEERDATPGAVNEDAVMALEAMKLALASLEGEPSYFVNRVKHSDAYGEDVELRTYCYELDALKSKDDFGGEIVPVYTAPPAPVSVPAAMEMDDDFDSAFEHGKAVGWNACRAAMLQGADGNAPAHFRSRPAQTSLSPAQCGNSPVIPDDWVLVPKEPTPAMLNAAWVSHGIYHASAYRTMLAAAPQQEVK